MKFSVENIELLQDDDIDKSQFSKLLVDCFSTEPSKHDTYVTEETLMASAKSMLLKPFVFSIDKRFDDISTHTQDEQPAGFVPHNAKIEFKRMNNGHLMMSTEVLIWKKYSGQLLEYFKRDGGRKSVSVEVEVFETRENKENGLLELVNFVFTCITALGDMITPAINSAQAVMAFSKGYEEAYNLEFGKYEEIDFQIPKSVKNSVKNALDKKQGSSVALALGRFLLNNEKATPERIRQMAKFFNRKNISEEDISFELFGGKAGRKWSTSLVKRMNEIDEKKISYFTEEEIMPYKSMDEVNESIKGIDPPVTLSQANEIRKQADSIDTDEKKNGWAIAISNFKKSHSVEDGKWVKKQNNSEFSVETPPDNYLGMENFSLDSSQIIEIINVCLSEFRYGDNWKKYWAESYDDEYTYVYDNEEDKRYRIPYTLNDKVCVCDMDKKEIVIRGGYEVMAEVENKDEKKFNYAEIFANEDFAKMFAEVENDEEEGEEREEGEKESYAKAKEEFGVGANPAAVMSAMRYAMKRMAKRYAKMKEKNEVYMSENADMKQKFAEQEEKEKNFAVETFLKELSEKVVVPEDKFAEMKEKAKEFSLSTIDGWKNHCKAFSFDFEKKSDKEEDFSSDLKRYALNSNNWTPVVEPSSPWKPVN